MYEKEDKNTPRRKDSVCNNWCWEDWMFTYKRTKQVPSFTPLTKMNLQWIKDLNVRPESIGPRRKHRKNTYFHRSYQGSFGYGTLRGA